MPTIELIPHAQDARVAGSYLTAVVDSKTGRMIVNMTASLAIGRYVELRCAGEGFGWHDKTGKEWRFVDGRWRGKRRW